MSETEFPDDDALYVVARKLEREAESPHPGAVANSIVARQGIWTVDQRKAAHLRDEACETCEAELATAWATRCPPEDIVAASADWSPGGALARALARHVETCEVPGECAAVAAAARPAVESRRSRLSLADLKATLGELTTAFRLTPALVPLRSFGTEITRDFVDEDGATLATVRGVPGVAQAELTVYFDDVALEAGPMVVALATGPDEFLAWHRFEAAGETATALVDVDPREAVADDVIVVFARQASAAEAPVFWEPWGRDDSLLELARYASPLALAGVALNVATQELRTGPTDADDDLRVAQALYERLRGADVKYALEPYLPPARSRQQIRDPYWMVRDKIGTCADLALSYASMALEAKVAPALAVGGGHVFVLLWLGRLIRGRSRPVPPGCAPAGDAVYEVVNTEELQRALDDGRLVAIETTGATMTRDLSFSAAREAARGLIGPHLRIVDVVAAHDRGYDPLPAPRRWPPLLSYLPHTRRPERLYRNQRRAIEQIDGRHGLVVLLGPQGQGKSTVALELVNTASHGAGWFLDASGSKRLSESLADAELQQRNVTATSLSAVSRNEYALGAQARLKLADDPWTVVLDNADEGPESIAALMPSSGPGQLVVVTTTHPDWRDVTGAHVVELDRIDDDDVRAVIDEDALLPLIGGRALMVDAVQRYLAAGGDARRVAGADPGAEVDEPVRGPLALYRALVTDHRDEPMLRREAATAALLPPDQIPVELLAQLAGDTGGAVAALVAGGVLTAGEETARGRLHRLLATAIRHDETASLPAAAVGLAGSAEARAIFDRWADADTVLEFAQLLRKVAVAAEGEPPDRELGLGLHGVAAVLETKGHTKVSAGLYTLAERHLDPDDDADRRRLADSWHGIARATYQQAPGKPDELRTALDLARRAERTVRELDGPGASGRFLAMAGLIEKALANTAPTREERAAGLESAMLTLEAADKARRDAPGVDKAELLRSRYNLAGIRIDRAKLERESASKLLREAKKIYEDVAAERVAVYGRPLHPHIAACHHGRGIVGLYEALLISQPVGERVRLLREASDAVWQGLKDRQTLGGGEDTPDVRKSLELLAKLTAFRMTVTDLSAEGARTWADGLLEKLLADLDDASAP